MSCQRILSSLLARGEDEIWSGRRGERDIQSDNILHIAAGRFCVKTFGIAFLQHGKARTHGELWGWSRVSS